jgi:uncharacterized membrane-anchored protein
MNKKLIVVIIGFLWIAIAAGMILSKEQTLRTGRMVVLETVPVDPRDFLRGDYVILRYKLSSLDLNQIESKKKWYRYHPGERIYVKLEPKGKFWQAVAIYEKKDGTINGLFIKGKVMKCYYATKLLEVNYGIESYFVPEGEGRDIEKKMRGNKGSVSVEVVVDSSGNALIKRVYIDE